MKTTSIITVTGALAIIVLALTKINRGSQETEVGTPVSEKSQTTPLKNRVSLVDILPFKDLQTANPFYVHPVAGVSDDRSHGGTEIMNVVPEQFLNEIVFLEEEEQVDLGFDVAEYLPADFDPYASTEPALDDIAFIEEDEEIDLGFDTAVYLPIGFDAFAGPDPDLRDIVFIEDEDPELGFDTQPYLPENFDPYAQPEPDLDDIVYIEEESTVELGFEVDAYLPAGFDPYAPAPFDLDNIIFLEEEEEIELWQESNTKVQEEKVTNVFF
jgi:hypothetical protein